MILEYFKRWLFTHASPHLALIDLRLRNPLHTQQMHFGSWFQMLFIIATSRNTHETVKSQMSTFIAFYEYCIESPNIQFTEKSFEPFCF